MSDTGVEIKWMKAKEKLCVWIKLEIWIHIADHFCLRLDCVGGVKAPKTSHITRILKSLH